MTNIVLGGSTPDDGFELKSARFDDGGPDYLSKTFAVAGDRRKWTFSCWVKRPPSSAHKNIFGPTGDSVLGFASDDSKFIFYQNAGNDFQLRTNARYRDPAAWYHFVVAYDTAQATAADRIKIYANGDRITSFSHQTNPSQNLESSWNNNIVHRIGAMADATLPFDGYLAEVYFIDGTALGPEYFGETNELTNQWQPKNPTDIKEAVTFGVNGFYLPFSDDALATSFTDFSSNTFTPSEALSVNCIVVGGGGAGAGSGNRYPRAGGGGAGGYLTGTGIAVSAQAYTVTVGAKGIGSTDMTGG